MELYDKAKILDKKSLGKLGNKSNEPTHDKLMGKKVPLTFNNLSQKENKYKSYNGFNSSHNKYTNK